MHSEGGDVMPDDRSNPYAAPQQTDSSPLQPPPDRVANDVATIQVVPEPYYAQVFTRHHVVMINVLGGIPGVLLLGGAGLIALAVDTIHPRMGLVGSIPLVTIGAVGALVGAVVAFWYPALIEDLYSRRKMREAIRLRPDSLIDPDSVDATFVSITLREHWSEIRLTTAADIGLLQIDDERSEVRIETDRERLHIPAGSVVSCKPECLYSRVDTWTANWLVRLVLQTQTQAEEVLLDLGHTDAAPRTNAARHTLANAVCQRINSLLTRDT